LTSRSSGGAPEYARHSFVASLILASGSPQVSRDLRRRENGLNREFDPSTILKGFDFSAIGHDRYQFDEDRVSSRLVFANPVRLRPRSLRADKRAFGGRGPTSGRHDDAAARPRPRSDAYSVGPAPPGFDRYGNANYDSAALILVATGVGTFVDNPDASTMGMPKIDAPSMSNMHCTGSSIANAGTMNCTSN
jgi:hypothetical protein